MNAGAAPSLLGPVTLRVRELPRILEFYRDSIGLRVHRRDDTSARLGAGPDDLLVLEERRDSVPARGAAGLYHVAFLVPSRAALALQLRHFAAAAVPLQGMSDHLVSEALYLADPEGNGIEIYCDRPRSEWQWTDGEVAMATMPIDVEGILAQGAVPDPGGWSGMPAGTTIGHVHLRVPDLASAGAFYRDVVGLDVTVRSYPGALFMSAGGYHHHLGLNTWGSVGAAQASGNPAGLVRFEIRPSTRAGWSAIRSRALACGNLISEEAGGFLLRDPAGIMLFMSDSRP